MTPAAELQETWEAWEWRHARTLERIGLAVLAYGAFWRITRYLMAMPVWGDEAMLLVNYPSRDYADVFGPIDYCQIAPLLFHWAEMTALRFLGPSEWSIRLPPLLGSVIGLGLFWLLARLLLSPLPRLIAVCVLSVAIWPATTGSLVKPYSWDLLFAVVLLLPFAAWSRDRARRWPLVLLCLLTPVALAASYPSVFVAGAIGLAIASPILRSRDPWMIGLLGAFGLLVAGVFFAHYQYVGKVHLASATFEISTADGMAQYWQKGFLPTEPRRLLVWLPLNLAGEIAAYPIGAQRGGSIVTLAISIVGARSLWRRGHVDLVLAFVGMLGLWLLASALHKYPFGSARLGQHAAPVFCLLFGAGAAVLLQRFASPDRARVAVGRVVTVLVLIGLAGQTRDFIRPYRNLEAKNSRAVVRSLFAACEAPVLMMQPELAANFPALNWYLATSGRTLRWVDSPDWLKTLRDEPSVWVVISTFAATPNEERAFQQVLAQTGGIWKCVERQSADVSGHGAQGVPLFRRYLFVQDRTHDLR